MIIKSIPAKTDSRIIKLFDRLSQSGNPILTSGGIPFEWDEHQFLIQPLCDFHPKQGINKCSQVGWSETSWIKAYYAARYLHLNVLYTLPTDSFVKDFVPPKVDKIIENNPHLFADISGGMYQKRVDIPEAFGNKKNARFIYFKGAHNTKASSSREESSSGVSITTDLNIHDEASKSDQFILSQMRSRLDNSLYKGRWLFDNPTYPKMGADSYYSESDQQHYFITCSRCGHKQYLNWVRLDKYDFKKALYTYIDPDKKKLICGKCAKPVHDYDRMNGEWVAKYPKKDSIRGYWVNQLMYVRHTVEDLLAKEEDQSTSSAHFQNFVLGRPYVGSDVKVVRQNMTQNMTMDINTLEDNFIGVDQGRTKWYVIGNQQGIFEVGSTESWDTIEKLMKQYNATVVCDALPEQLKPKQFANKYKGRFWRAFYKHTSDQASLWKFVPEKEYTVLIQRNETFDTIVDSIMTGNFPMQLNPNDVPEFIDHWTSMVRIVQKDKNGNQRFDWVETGADHFAHATLYWWIAMKRARAGVTVVKKTTKADTNRLKKPSSVDVY